MRLSYASYASEHELVPLTAVPGLAYGSWLGEPEFSTGLNDVVTGDDSVLKY